MMTFTIEELRRLEAEATPGEWKRYDFNGFVGVTPVDEDEADVANTCGMTGETEDDRERALANAALIVAMRNALPELLRKAEAFDRIVAQGGEPHGGIDVG